MGVSAMKSGLIGTAMSAFWCKLLPPSTASRQIGRYSKLDDHLLEDLGKTREQACELDQRHEAQAERENPD
jgi:hypothetical protein